MRASTGNAVMLIEAPRNRANGVNLPVADPSCENSTRAAPTPNRNGKMMLTWLTSAAADPRPLINRVSSSRPIRNMKKMRPTSASTLRNGSTFGENR